MVDLGARVDEQLAVRAKRRREELLSTAQRIASSRNEVSVREELMPLTLEDLKAITTQTGFLEAQLEVNSLSTLHRWFIQLLQQLEHETSKDSAHGLLPDEQAGVEPLARLGQDRRCFDVCFATATRAQDVKMVWLDVSDCTERPWELLTFSTTQNGHTTRCVLFTTSREGHVNVRTSHFVPGVEANANSLVASNSHASCLLDLLHY